jgi:hypothetical protein
MDKAYDPKALLAELKSEGLPVVETGAEGAVKALFRWLNQSADLSTTPYDNFAKLIYPHLESAALAQIDKVDGQPG